MPELTEAAAKAEFGQRMATFLDTAPATGMAVVDAFIAHYREVRIQNADDSVMLEWGSSSPHLLKGFTDLREIDVEWDENQYQWIGLTRQVQSGNEDDDTALCVSLYFELSTGDEPSSNIEFWGFNELEAALQKFLQKKFVSKLLATPPSRVTAFACEVG